MGVIEQPVAANATSWVRDALGQARTPRMRRLARAVTVGAAVWEIGRKVHGKARERITYSVTVPGTDEAFDLVSAWLTDQVPSRARRSLQVTTRRRGSDSGVQPRAVGESEPEPPKPTLGVAYDGSRSQTVRVDGHRVSVQMSRSGLTDGLNVSVNTGGDSTWERSLRQITFLCYGESARDAVLRLLDGLSTAAQSGQARRPRMNIARRWGDWQRIRDVSPRELRTVILADGQSERIVADLERFLSMEDRYGRVGIPWHRGYLFHGPPGCGKTSFATALADRFGLDVYLLPLSDLDADVNLVALLGQVDPAARVVYARADAPVEAIEVDA